MSNTSIIQRHDEFMSNNYARVPIAMVQGEGSRLHDAHGNEYLDLFSGFGAPLLGHCHPELVEELHAQSQKLWHVGNLLHTKPQTLLAEKLSHHSDGMKSFFCASGAEANEAAIKLARLYGQSRAGTEGPRHGIVCALHSFHGRLFGTMQATGQEKVREGFTPHLPGFSHVPYADIQALEETINPRTVAIMLEPIQGEGGMHVPSAEYMQQVRALCDRYDLLLICDEVWTGCARTGRAFCHQHYGVQVDLMTLAKGLGGGLPLAAVMMQPHIADLFNWKTHGRAVHGTTLGGNPLTTAVAHKMWEIIERDNLIDRAARLGDLIKARFRKMATTLPCIRDIRGKGLFIGVELDTSLLPSPLQSASDVFLEALDKGLLINATQGEVLRIAPALTIPEAELNEGLNRIEAILKG